MKQTHLCSSPTVDAAGNPTRDLRSPRRANQRANHRAKKCPERIYSGNKSRRRSDPRIQHLAHLERRKDTHTHLERQEWEEDWHAEWQHKFEMEFMDAIVAYERFGKNAHIFECRGAFYEDSGAWARRRIEEMRRVEEDGIFGLTGRVGRKYVGRGYMYQEYIYPTTQPTTLFDMDAQYTWRWHRNFSGCWVLGYDNQCQGDAVPCTCCNVGNGSMSWPCFCADFDLDAPAPEEVQRSSLVEWVKGKLMGMIEDQEELGEWEDELDEEWDVVSYGDSLDWEVLSENEFK